ncbi:MAG: putative DNA binding domain-containing protein [Deltaproteobacteria bacterium]|nr:putative DNA binding domain-containing protein [Deltaproteobacteria bacterium]
MLSDAELIRLIKGGESDRVEFTTSTNDLDKFRVAMCAFANDLPNHKKPGVLFIGLDDHGNCANLRIDDTLLQKLGGLRADGNILPFPIMSVDKKYLRNCEVAIIQVEPSENPPVRVKGCCWIRSGPRRAQATAEEERHLVEKRRWGNLPYDMHGVTGATLKDDLDMQKFQSEYLPNAVSTDVLRENQRNSEDQLKALRLVARDGTPTVTAILMLGTDPIRWFPGAYIQFVRYDGNNVTDPIIDQDEVHGTISDQLRQADVLLKRNISTALEIQGSRHIENPDYPYLALREILHNAVIHRNYENSHTPVRITWLSDHVEIASPGSVYGAVTKQNFAKSNVTSYRNPTIAEAMKNQGFMERFGRGIPIVRQMLAENGNPAPEFCVEDNFVFATIHRWQS